MVNAPRIGWRKWALAFGSATIVLMAAGYWVYRVEADEIHRAQFSAVAAVGQLKSDQIEQWRRERSVDAAVAARDPAFAIALPALSNPALPALRARARARLKSVAVASDYTDGLLTSMDGRVLLAAHDSTPPLDSATRAAIMQAAQTSGGVLSDLFLGRDDSVFIDAVSVVRDGMGRPLGAIALRANARTYLYPLIDAWPNPSRSAETVLIERRGNDVLSLSDLRYEANSALRWRRSLTLVEFPAVQAVLGRRGPVEGVDYRGVDVLADLRAIPGSPWLMVAKVDADELLAEARYRAWVISLMVASLILAAAAVTAYGYRRRQAGVFRGLYESTREAQAALVQSLERFQLANRATFDVIWDYDPQANTLWHNDNFRERFGYPSQDAEIGLESWSSRVHEDDRARARAGLDAAVASTATFWSDSYRFRRRDGTYAMVEDRGNIVRDAEGRAVRVIGAMQDVTQMRRAEQGIRRLNRVYAVLSEINQAIVRIRDQPALFERACAIAVERGQLRMAWVGLRDGHSPELRVAASAGLSAGYLETVKIDIGDPTRGSGPTGVAVREGRHDVCNDIEHDPRMAPWRDRALRLGFRSSAAFPLIVDRVVRGAFTLYAAEPDFFDRDELALLDDLAMSISFAMELAEQESNRRQLEAQFLQAQKMETVGRLAGGIAHDFNNLLTVINGTAGMLLEYDAVDAGLRRDLMAIKDAGDRAAALTRQLLAFSRQQLLTPDVIDLNALVGRMQPMLRRLISENIDLVVTPGAALGSVRADPGQIEQVVLNLVVNASDAMPAGGTLTIETENADLDSTYAESHPSVPPGAYVVLSIADTGTGMDEAIRQKIFEPFFTTKEAGKGTGLGLATVYGIIKQSEGSVWVDSQPGRGSVFKIYLPRVAEGAPSRTPAEALAMPRGTETILLVEDDEAVRRLAARILTAAGYTVLPAADGAEALEILGRQETPIQLLLSDVVLPGISGRELAARVAERYPEIGVLLTSGYTDDAMLRMAVTDSTAHFLGKPYTAVELTRRVREVLDAP
ncbi:MAG TPA: ATP-binding protein [Gemmatimonadaceae bacterium]|nr:ATP-binding protein [Gemmatimonadaceae bacterium]